MSKKLALGLGILCATWAGAQDLSDPGVQQGVEDWKFYHADVLQELKGLSTSQEPGAEEKFFKLRGQLMHSVAGPLFDAAGIPMPNLNDPAGASQLMQTLLQGVGKLSKEGKLPTGPSTGGTPLPSGMPADSGFDLGSIQKLLGGMGGGSQRAPKPQGYLELGSPGQPLKSYAEESGIFLEGYTPTP